MRQRHFPGQEYLASPGRVVSDLERYCAEMESRVKSVALRELELCISIDTTVRAFGGRSLFDRLDALTKSPSKK
jgi:hypothetical protein